MLNSLNVISKRFHSSESHIRRFNIIKDKFELNHRLLPDTFIVVCLDGVNFKQLCSANLFLKPVDQRHINLMNACAVSLMSKHSSDIVCAYGFSDEFSFVLKTDSELFKRNSSHLASILSSQFTFTYAKYWPLHFYNGIQGHDPCFKSNIFHIPNKETLQRYLNLRQFECHFNHLYNSVLWKLIKKGQLSPAKAQKKLLVKIEFCSYDFFFVQFEYIICINFAE